MKKCPDCNYPLYCPCDDCIENLKTPDDVVPYEWIDEELRIVECPKCKSEVVLDYTDDTPNDSFTEFFESTDDDDEEYKH